MRIATLIAVMLLAGFTPDDGHSKCIRDESIDEFNGKPKNGFACITEDRAATFVMMCDETGYLMAVNLVKRYMEAEGERIKMEYSIDRGRITGETETRVQDFGGGDQQQIVVNREAVERLSGYFLKAEQLAVRSTLKYHGMSTAVFRFDSSSRSAHADFVNACGR